MHYRLVYFGVDLRLTSQTQQQTSETTDMANALCGVPVYSPSFAGHSLCLPTEEWHRLSWPGCLVLQRDGLPVLKQSPIHALTGPGVE